RNLLRHFLPAANGPLKSPVVCMYTNAPDEHFILDYHPAHPQVLIASPCSGHGFKFSPVIGEVAATLLDHQTAPFDLTLFRPLPPHPPPPPPFPHKMPRPASLTHHGTSPSWIFAALSNRV